MGNCTADEMAMSTKCTVFGTCCEKDATKCGGNDKVTCPSGKILDMSKAGTAVGMTGATCCKSDPTTVYAPLCVLQDSTLTSGANQFQWMAISLILSIYGAAMHL